MSKKWQVYMGVAFETLEQWKEINSIALKINPNYCGAGTGFDERDMDWEVETKAKAESQKDALEKAFNKAGYKRVRVHIFND